MFEQSWTGVSQNIDRSITAPLSVEKPHLNYQYSPEYDIPTKKIKKQINVLRFPLEKIDACVSVTELCGEFTHHIDEDLLDIIEVPIDEVLTKQGGLFFELAQKAGMEKESAEQLRTTVLESIESEISKAGLQLTDDAKQLFLDTLLVVMKKTDEYIRENQ